jgi:putative oxidoreductase
MPGPIPARWGPRLLSVLRIFAAFLFMAHGAQKLFAWPASEPREAVALLSLMGLAGVLEFFGGLLLFLGLFTRPVAFVLAGEMAVAYAMAHAPRGFWPIVNHGELAVLYFFLFLYFGAVGGGPWSLDALRPHRDPARRSG